MIKAHLKTMITLFALNAFAASVAVQAADQGSAPTVIKVETFKAKGGPMEWKPGVIDVKAGEKVHFIVSLAEKTGPDVHGFSIPDLGVTKEVSRSKPLEFDLVVPADKVGKHEIICQLHPAHKHASLDVAK